ncbi:MAG: hypothetical protein K2Y28_02520 [Burkholderiaceae bacterium]|nr:hypothetical protein [Burkholderiaceae bacterium]
MKLVIFLPHMLRAAACAPDLDKIGKRENSNSFGIAEFENPRFGIMHQRGFFMI